MKRFLPYIKLLPFCLLLFLVLQGDSTDGMLQEHDPSDTAAALLGYEGNELVLLWDNAPSQQELTAFFSVFPGINLVESLENYMLISVSNSLALSELLTQVRTYPGIVAADPNYTLPSCIASPAQKPTHAPESLARTLQALSPMIPSAITEMPHPVREVIVAVADTGIDILHPDLKDSIWTNDAEIADDGIDNDGNGYIDDRNGWDFYHNDSTVCHYETADGGHFRRALANDNDNHGTHVAGIIVNTCNEYAVSRKEAISVKIMPLKIHGGEKAAGSVANAVKAIKYAVMMGADICNISWGASSLTSSISTLEQAIKEADLLFITAAGNTGADNDLFPVYPASFDNDNVISVTFVDEQGNLTDESNYGATSVDIAAHGTQIFSTIIDGYAFMTGSSMAVPQVSAMAAILFSFSEGLYPAAIKDLLLSTAVVLPELEGKLISGGVPNLQQAISSFRPETTDTTTPILTLTPEYRSDYISLKVTAEDSGGAGIRVIKYAVGDKTRAAFRRGTAGISVTQDEIRPIKPGQYTFYVSDYAGNETLLPFILLDDTVAPQIEYSTHSAVSGKRHQLIASIFDFESAVLEVSLLPGEYTADDFPKGEAKPLSLTQNRINLRLYDAGRYTLYATDIRGNTSVVVFDLPATAYENRNSEVSDIE